MGQIEDKNIIIQCKIKVDVVIALFFTVVFHSFLKENMNKKFQVVLNFEWNYKLCQGKFVV